VLSALGDLERHRAGFSACAGRPVPPQPNELFVGRFAHRRGREHDLSELVEPFLLLLVKSLE
jgi:hypothetical protein